MGENDVKKSLLILKSQKQSLLPVESFLRNRDWVVQSTTSLKEALTYLVSDQPQYVLISIEHPNKKTKNLPKVLMSAMPVCVAMFAENSSAASFKDLSSASTEYKLFPPVTGPAVERMVHKYLKDQTTSKSSNLASESFESNKQEGNNLISIKGSLSAGILAQLMGMDESAINASILNEANNNIGAGYTPSSNDESSMMSQSSKPSYMPPADWAQSSGNETDPYSGRPAPKEVQPLSPQYSNEDFEELDLRAKHKAAMELERSKENALPKDDSDKINLEKQSLNEITKKSAVKNDFTPYLSNDSLISKATESALSESCTNTDTMPGKLIYESTNIACIVIDSTRFAGYLVAAMGENRKIDNVFIDKVRSRLFDFLKENGENTDDSESSMSLKITPVPFQAWATDCANFLRKSVHNGDEIAMAFFPNTSAKTEIIESARSDMARVGIDEICCDLVLEFNIYLYMPRNDRYILYTPKGGIFYTHQKKMLTSRSVTEFHVQKNEMYLVARLRAQSYLNETIKNWQTLDPHEDVLSLKKVL